MTTDGSAARIELGRTPRFDTVVIDADGRMRMKLTMNLSGAVSVPSYETVDEALATTVAGRATVLVCGPAFANPHGIEAIHQAVSQRAEIGVLLVADELSTELLQRALRAGTKDVVALSGGETALRESVLRIGEALGASLTRTRAANEPAALGKLVVSFSTKGGVGKSTVAVNTAISLARRCERPVALIDVDLQFGDVAVLLGIPPRLTVVDAVGVALEDDPELVLEFMSRHEASGLLVLPAPVEPSAADQVGAEDMLRVVTALRKLCDFVVVDMPPHFNDIVLTMVEAADDVLIVASMDVPSVKNLKVGMQTLDLLSLAGDKLRLVLNRATSRVRLDVKEVERALQMVAEFPIPSDIAVPQAVNRGLPVVLDNPTSPAAVALERIALTLLGIENVEQDAERDPKRRRKFGRGKD